MIERYKRWRTNRIKAKVAGMKAKLAATKQMVDASSSIPGAVVIDIQNLSYSIAACEERLRQLEQ